MRLELPSGLHYPLVIKRIDKKVGDQVKVRDHVFFYSYVAKVKQQKSKYEEEEVEVDKTMHAFFESPAEGVIDRWLVWEGDTIRGPGPILDLTEECKHSVVFNGMCTECGKDVTEFHEERDTALVQAAHDTNKLLISKEEAAEVDESAKKRLLAARKLSLVVDLDQTIVHAAVDPTVGEWQKDPTNPNYEALQDVVAFQLLDDIQAQRGCWYYIKLRPGLQEFLESVAEKYELHVYTMGTRQYAEQIVKIVDPDHRFFDDRILSRDESGSMEAKSLARIFPVDTKMVVIIDDRADVWKYSPNLVRVTVFDFFAGVGDINAGFLPKKQEIPMFPEPEVEEDQSPENQNGDHTPHTEPTLSNGTPQEEIPAATDTTALQQVVAMATADRETGDMAKTQEKTIAAQVEDKPLLKLQQKMDEYDKADSSTNSEPATQATESDSSDSESSTSARAKRHSILRNDDEELIHLERSLHSIHDRFFSEYDKRRSSAKGGRVAALAGKRKEPVPETDEQIPLAHIPDIKKIVPSMKQRVLEGETIVFSGIIPLKLDTKSADISLWAQSFGARIADKISKAVTHVVANRSGSHKVNSALQRGIPVVNLQWLIQSMQRWKKLDDRPYLLKGIGQRKLEDEPVEEMVDQDTNLLDDVLLGQQPDLLSSEEGSVSNDTTDDEDGPRRKKAKLAVTVPAPEASNNQEDQDIPHSPVNINADEWADMDDELRDFMGSDLDSESDTESIKSELAQRPKKRRREDNDRDDGHDSDVRNGDHKRAKTSGSALKAVHNIDSSSGSTPVGVLDDQDVQDEEDEEDELARELEAALEEADE